MRKKESESRPNSLLEMPGVVAVAQPPRIEDRIRERAYELFEARGREEGHELGDWLRAEDEIAGHKREADAA